MPDEGARQCARREALSAKVRGDYRSEGEQTRGSTSTFSPVDRALRARCYSWRLCRDLFSTVRGAADPPAHSAERNKNCEPCHNRATFREPFAVSRIEGQLAIL